MKSRGIDKKMFAEHKQLVGLKELDAKAKYTKNCRDLKTYGVAFFLVKVRKISNHHVMKFLFSLKTE